MLKFVEKFISYALSGSIHALFADFLASTLQAARLIRAATIAPRLPTVASVSPARIEYLDRVLCVFLHLLKW